MAEDAEHLGVVGPLPEFVVDAERPAGLSVALPAHLHDQGWPAQALLDEWAVALDPIAHLRLATGMLRLRYEGGAGDVVDWIIVDGVTVKPSAEALHWLRQAAKDEGVVGDFKTATCELRDDWLERTSVVRQETTWDGTTERLTHELQPVLIGLAVISTVRYPIGIAGREAARLLVRAQGT
jgi:hypothetical protein